MKLAADNTLIPCVKMGVEARQQVCRDGTLEDAAITSKNHPLRSRLGSNGRRFVTKSWKIMEHGGSRSQNAGRKFAESFSKPLGSPLLRLDSESSRVGTLTSSPSGSS